MISKMRSADIYTGSSLDFWRAIHSGELKILNAQYDVTTELLSSTPDGYDVVKEYLVHMRGKHFKVAIKLYQNNYSGYLPYEDDKVKMYRAVEVEVKVKKWVVLDAKLKKKLKL